MNQLSFSQVLVTMLKTNPDCGKVAIPNVIRKHEICTITVKVTAKT